MTCTIKANEKAKYVIYSTPSFINKGDKTMRIHRGGEKWNSINYEVGRKRK